MTAIARKNARTAGIMALMVAGMLALAFASVPLYRMFCELTGFDGTPLRAERAPGAVAGEIGVRFDANINPALPWKFEPVQETIRIAPGSAHADPLPGDEPDGARDDTAKRRSTSRPRSPASISRRSSASASPSRR